MHGIFHPFVSLPLQADNFPTFLSCADFVAEHPEYVVEKNAMNFLSDNGGNSYNLCHCTFFTNQTKGVGSADHVHYQKKKKVWSNFEIADMDFWRGEAYSAFFEYLDSLGGFYYEVTSSLSPLPARSQD